jgi:uncharacterized protein YndB with AHSA1/START domain
MSEQNGGDIVIERTFDASREAVWRAWTVPEEFARWYGPQGFSVPECRMDVRVGGERTCCMAAPNGFRMWTAGTFQEVAPVERLVFTEHTADEHGNPVPPSHYGMPGDSVLHTLVTITLAEEAGGTRLTLRHGGFPPEQARSAGAGAGWNQAFDKLAVLMGQGA